MIDNITFYPKRTDAVQAVFFDGEPESVQRIAKITGGHVTAEVGTFGGFSSVTIDGIKVEQGSVIVVDRAGTFQALDLNDFDKQYSKDGY